MADCPTPGKHRYATPEAAALAAECRCGWVHLTKLRQQGAA